MLLGFKERFAEPILIGTKVFTMRNERKREPNIGETLFMYTGLRTNKCRLISNQERLISMQWVTVKIERHNHTLLYKDGYNLNIVVDRNKLSVTQLEEFVKFDGFKDTKDFCEYWIKSSYAPRKAPNECNLKGHLRLYHWTDLRY